jgi:hypothetical protein
MGTDYLSAALGGPARTVLVNCQPRIARYGMIDGAYWAEVELDDVLVVRAGPEDTAEAAIARVVEAAEGLSDEGCK